MPITVEQCRAARALLGWSIGKLASDAAVGIMTVNRFEGGDPVRPASIEKIQATLEAAGITFVADGEVSHAGGEGVRLTTRSRGAT